MSGGKRLPDSHCETERICGIQFEMFKASEIKQVAVCHVTSSVAYSINGEAKYHGLADPHMGSNGQRPCETCHMLHPDCPGHFGYTELSEPLYHIGLFDVTYQLLQCVCKTCGNLLADVDAAAVESKDGAERLRAVKQAVGTRRRCQRAGKRLGCDAEQPTITKATGRQGLVLYSDINNVRSVLTAAHAYKVLDSISNEDAITLGFKPDRAHPRDLILTVLPIPPPPVRPSVGFGGARSENELTVHLISILKLNEKLRHNKDGGASEETLRTDVARLQELIAIFINNSSTYYNVGKLRGRMPIKSLSERLKGKQGRLRGYLMGKRVDFSARTVITGDPMIDVDQVGVPRSVAMTLTVPEKVNWVNRQWLTSLVQSTSYPSANYIIHKNGTQVNLEYLQSKARKGIKLEIGDVVERHVLDGDPVLFNRQPTLHRMSMMGHRARVLPFNTFRLNLSCTTPYNADFDGDEMNLHVPQSLLTKAELIEIMMVPKNFVTPNKSQPCMGIVQDSLLGCYRITDKETFLDKYFLQNLFLWLTRTQDVPIPAILKPEPLWTGKQVFGMVVPEVTIGISGKHKFGHDDNELLIRRGRLISGMINKGVVGVSPGSLIHVIFNEKGADEVTRFINGVQRTVAFYLYNASFSVGLQDTVAGTKTQQETTAILVATEQKVKQIASEAVEGVLHLKPGLTLLRTFERECNVALNQCRQDAAKKALSTVRRTNSFRVMINAGSKGSELNIYQIAVMVGQQNVNGERIPFHFRRRSLPHFCKDDYGAPSRGLVKRGFLDGLTPTEFYFHTMGGREGLIDTACKTADTGYLQRKLIKSMEDVHAAYDGTARTANREVVQFLYGEDGLDGHRIEQNQHLTVVGLNDAEMAKAYRFEYDADGAFTQRLGEGYMPPELKRMLRADASTVGVLDEEFKKVMQARDELRGLFMDDISGGKVTLSLPVNVERLIRNAQAAYEVGRQSQQFPLDPRKVISSVELLQRDIQQLFASHHKQEGGELANPLCRERIEQATRLFGLHLRTMLASKRVLNEFRLSEKAFQFLLGEIRLKYLQSIVHPGEMIGAIAAQSCGEPATQMTLNTFHNAGISSKNVTLGVPRLLELLNVSKHQRVSNMVIHLKAPANKDNAKVGEAMHAIEFASLATVTKRWTIIYDPDPENTIVEEDAGIVQEWLTWYQGEVEPLGDSPSPWVARIELDGKLLGDKGIVLTSISSQLKALGRYNVIDSLPVDTNAESRPVVLRLRLLNAQKDLIADHLAFLKEDVPEILRSTHVSGIPGVVKVFKTDKNRYVVDAGNGALVKEDEMVIETEGTALRAVMGNVMDRDGHSIVEPYATSSNNLPEICEVLGIEAARRKLFLEMREVYTGYDIRINYRQYALLVDTMCHRGYLMAVSRTGINRSNTVGPLMRCSFEETVKVLMGAAAFGEFDPCRGVSANLLLGNQSRVGTGIFDLVLNIDMLTEGMEQKDLVQLSRAPNVYAGASTIRHQAADRPAAPAGAMDTPLFNRSVVGGSAAYGAAPSAAFVPVASAPVNYDAVAPVAMAPLLPLRPAGPTSAVYVPTVPSAAYAAGPSSGAYYPAGEDSAMPEAWQIPDVPGYSSAHRGAMALESAEYQSTSATSTMDRRGRSERSTLASRSGTSRAYSDSTSVSAPGSYVRSRGAVPLQSSPQYTPSPSQSYESMRRGPSSAQSDSARSEHEFSAPHSGHHP